MKKTTLLFSAAFLSISFLLADDTAIKETAPKVEVTKENSQKPEYTFLTKKVEELSEMEALLAGSYAQGYVFFEDTLKSPDFDLSSFLNGYENGLKSSAVPFNEVAWQEQVKLYRNAKSKNEELTSEEKTKFFTSYGDYIVFALKEAGLDRTAFLQAIKDKLAQKNIIIPKDDLDKYLKALQPIMIAKIKSAGSKFLEENKKKEGVVELPSKLQYKILKAGTGEPAKNGQTLKIHYVGTTIDGTEFDSSVKRNQTFDLKAPINGVIDGWVQVLKLMNKGAKWQVYIPEDLAYGERGSPPNIKPFATLIFDIEIVDITD